MSKVSFVPRVLSLYARTLRTYGRNAHVLLALGALVFLPLGLIESISLDVDLGDAGLGSGLAVLALIAVAGAITATSVVGEVFYSGAVALLLTHPHDGEPLTLGGIARHISYRTLIVVDLIFVLLVVAGLTLLIVPGIVAFTWFVLAGTVVEIEGRGVRGAFARSRHLVRGRFFTVLVSLGLLQLVEESVAGAAATVGESILGHGYVAEWLVESAANVAFAPIYAVTAVLLALDLIAEKGGATPGVDSEPARA